MKKLVLAIAFVFVTATVTMILENEYNDYVNEPAPPLESDVLITS